MPAWTERESPHAPVGYPHRRREPRPRDPSVPSADHAGRTIGSRRGRSAPARGGTDGCSRDRAADIRPEPLRVGPYRRHAKRMPDGRCIGRVGPSGADIDAGSMAGHGAFRCRHRWAYNTVVGAPSFSANSSEDSGPSVLLGRTVQPYSAGTGGATECRGRALSPQLPSPAPSPPERTRPGRATVPWRGASCSGTSIEHDTLSRALMEARVRAGATPASRRRSSVRTLN